MQKKRDILGKI